MAEQTGVLTAIRGLVILLGAAAAWAGRPASGEEPPGGRAPVPVPLLDGDPAVGRWVGLTAETTLPGGGQPEGFEWRQVEGPALWHFDPQRHSARVWAFIERPGRYRFTVRVRGAREWSAPVPLDFKVPDRPPVLPLAEARAFAGAGEQVILPGEGWRQLHGPPARLRESSDRRETTFRLLVTGLYLFEALHAGDQPERRGFWVPPGRDETMADRRPIAMLPLALNSAAGETVLLDAGLSYDPDGPDEKLEAHWQADLLHGATLVRQEALKARFQASRAGVYRVVLTVSDGKLDSLPVERFIQVAPVPGDEDDPAAAPASQDPLDRRVTLRLYESQLDWAVQKFPNTCGVSLRVDKALAPPERFSAMPLLGLGAENAPVRLIADWIARQTDACYHREPEGSLWLTTAAASCATERLESLALGVDALHQAPDGKDLMDLLRGCFGSVLTARPDATLSYDAAKEQVVAVLPLSALQRLRAILAQLRAPKGLGLPLPAGRSLEGRRMRRWLAQTTVSLDAHARRLDFLLRDLVAAGKVAVGFDPRQFPQGLPRVTLRLDGVPLREAARAVCAAADFDGCQVADGGLWFYRGGEPRPSREQPWQIATVRAYDLEPVLARLPLLSGEALAHHIRQRVFPASWKEPGAWCGFHGPTGKLVIVHEDAAQERVLNLLWDLLVRGEAALGPVIGK